MDYKLMEATQLKSPVKDRRTHLRKIRLKIGEEDPHLGTIPLASHCIADSFAEIFSPRNLMEKPAYSFH
jgi:hypothetical protein